MMGNYSANNLSVGGRRSDNKDNAMNTMARRVGQEEEQACSAACPHGAFGASSVVNALLVRRRVIIPHYGLIARSCCIDACNLTCPANSILQVS